MNKKALQIKVFMVHLLIKLHILPNVWYSCEIELAKLRAAELVKIFGWED